MEDIDNSLGVVDNTIKKSVVRLIDGGWSVASSQKKEVYESHNIIAAFFGEDSSGVALEYAKWKYGDNLSGFRKEKAKIELDGEIRGVTNIEIQKGLIS